MVVEREQNSAELAEHVGPPGIVQAHRGIAIMVNVQDVPAGAVIAAARGIHRSRRIMVLRQVSDFDRLELPLDFIERGPDRDAGIGHQAIHDLVASGGQSHAPRVG